MCILLVDIYSGHGRIVSKLNFATPVCLFYFTCHHDLSLANALTVILKGILIRLILDEGHGCSTVFSTL